ncbi:FG-GAP-like repeat-containing protein [Mariniflexile soesokkakense]|uniref:FG-GAP-like repeat-containing protein n=1 Tax=Mariniflexile soesokkakense TaxID=1343160 RepID=A0ABV0ABJ5_9FLAO
MKHSLKRKPSFFFVVLLFLITCNFLKAQTFNRIETVAGLSVLEENNGVAIADYNKDGFLDMFVVALGKDQNGVEKTHSRLLKNNNDGTFSDVTEAVGLLLNLFPLEKDGTTYDKVFEGVKHGAFWGDYDNDGYPDLFMTNVYQVYLFHNEGNGTFIDVTETSGLNIDSRCINTGATWFDYNKDGFLDLYISDWKGCDSNSFYENNGDGTFTSKIDLFGNTEHKNSLMSIPFDFNNDGWMDLYLANDVINRTNDLFINQKGKGFTEEASKYGLDHARNDMGIAFGDYNNDGFFDMYITDVLLNPLLTNKGDNTFVDLAVEQGVQLGGWSWDTVFSDFDLDGDEDLLVLNGFEYKGHSTEKNIYYQNRHANGIPKFIDKSVDSNLGELTISVGAGVFDFDNDGDEDILVTNTDRPSFFYENKTRDFTNTVQGLNWLKVNLEGTISNRDAIGTKLVLKTNKGKLSRYYSGKGFLSQNLKSVHFGLANANQIQELRITWPSGLIEIYNDLPLNKTINFKEGNSYTIPNIAPSIKLYGCTDPNSCNYNPNATISSGDCVYLKTVSSIYGNSNALKFSIEDYSYPPQSGNTVTWDVIGGSILEGKTANTVKVQWETGTEGTISVIEKNNSCSSKSIVLKVKLRSDSDPIPPVNKKSVARLWNEVLLNAIRKDFARPTVHARNLFHTSIVMYDAWAVYDENAKPYLLGNTVHQFTSDFEGFQTTETIELARDKTISYAAYRLLKHRFQNSPKLELTMGYFDNLMQELGYDINNTSLDYKSGNSIALGNYIAKTIIDYGYTDGSNEINKYKNSYYQPVNPPILLNNPDINEGALLYPNRWQPLSFDTFIDQSGNLIEGATPAFLGAEWGNVKPFNLEESEKKIYTRAGQNYIVYDDPGMPPQLDLAKSTPSSDAYKWSFSLNTIWSSHLNPHDNVMWDISPKSMGNINFNLIPKSVENHKYFYDLENGGDISKGHTINPRTNAPYKEQIVPRGDYTRVLAEFWADGPDSETPPGHWFSILNYVSDHELFKKKFNGTGNVLNNLEWDVKSYFVLGGAMHDAAISAWSIKGWYDYIRPISAIRFMAEKGQSSDASKSNYNIAGIPLVKNFIETVEIGDPLAGENNKNIGKIKLYAWKGHDFILNTNTDEAGVGWILAENWWPYQRISFVTPPFAGYVSGHSTFSRTAAEVLTLITGDEYFPGGMGEFFAKKDKFLVFEKGPSVDVTLQWATYRDASDQCSLSRIWGGIHPPADDIPGRIIGERIGKKAYDYATSFFDKDAFNNNQKHAIFPNPLKANSEELIITNTNQADVVKLFDLNGRYIQLVASSYSETNRTTILKFPKSITTGIFILKINNKTYKIVVQ